MRKSAFVAAASATAVAAVLALTGASALPTSHHGFFGSNYVAALAPLNQGAHTVDSMMFEIPTTRGVAAINQRGDAVRVVVGATGVEPSTVHLQHIHAGMKCPDMSDDTNHDGFVDIIEGLPDYGPVLISLDSDLNSFGAHDMFPTASAQGQYFYTEHASATRLEQELMEPLRFGERHVVIHGVAADTPLPATVQSLPGVPAHVTLPVACGELRSVG
jgi:hypothetical protein